MKLPVKPGLTVLTDLPVEKVAQMIDWKMFLVSWDFRTAAARESAEAEELLHDGRRMLDRIISGQMLSVDGIVRILPAETADHDDIVLYEDENRKKILKVLPMLRRQIPRNGACPSLADFIVSTGEESREPGVDDYMGFFAVTAGGKVEKSLKLFEQEDLYSPLLLKSLADRLAEAGAEYLHRLVRRELWGYERGAEMELPDILAVRYRGIRPAPGYPCCPDHTGKRDIFDLLDAENHIGVHLTETYMMQPAASVCGYLFGSSRSEYFPVGRIGEDQLISYSRRKKMPEDELRRWLSVNIGD